MAYVAPTTRSDGYVVDASEWNKNTVDNPIALRTGALAIPSQAANDIVIATSASQLGRVAAGTAGQVLQTNGAGSAPTWVSPSLALAVCGGRLTLTTAVPVTTADVTAATTLYFALYKGNRIALYNGSAWQSFSLAELSIAIPATTNQMYDVFVQYNSGTPQLAAVAWTNDTTRATALTTQDGVLVKTGATGDRYVGSFRTTGVSGQTEDSLAKRYVWNYYNRVARPLRVTESANSWTPASDGVIQQANASAANQLDIVVGVAEDEISIRAVHQGSNSAGGVFFASFIGLDATNAKATGCLASELNPAANQRVQLCSTLDTIPAIGRHFFSWLEVSATAATTAFFGDNGGTSVQSGITARWKA